MQLYIYISPICHNTIRCCRMVSLLNHYDVHMLLQLSALVLNICHRIAMIWRRFFEASVALQLLGAPAKAPASPGFMGVPAWWDVHGIRFGITQKIMIFETLTIMWCHVESVKKKQKIRRSFTWNINICIYIYMRKYAEICGNHSHFVTFCHIFHGEIHG